EVPHRMVLNNLDIVHTKAKTVEELLLNFDLPCCRAGFNSKNDYWVSAQCLYALLTGRYYLPSYLKDYSAFSNLMNKYRGDDPMKMSEKALYDRMGER